MADQAIVVVILKNTRLIFKLHFSLLLILISKDKHFEKKTTLYHIKWYPDYIEMNYYLHLIISQYNSRKKTNLYHIKWYPDYIEMNYYLIISQYNSREKK